MASPSRQVQIPESVEQFLEKIWTEKGLTTRLDHQVRGRLASIGEKDALQLLHKFSSVNSTIRSPNAYIDKMIDSHLCSQPSPTTPAKRVALSPIHNPSSSSSSFIFPNNVEKLEALGELEFRKQFVILSYCGGKELENVSITAEEIRCLKDLSMIQFESKVWECLGKLHVERQDRRVYLEWDSEQGYIFQVFVSNEGTFRFKGPILNKARTHLQKKVGDDNVLMVKFADRSDGYAKIIREGIPVGLRRYRLFVFKEEGRKAKDKTSTSLPVKCFFVRIESEAKIDKFGSYKLSDKPIGEARCFFMHAHTLSSMSKYMSRLSLILSKTITLDIDWSKLKIETIEDEYCLDESGNRIIRDGKSLIQTDGTGYISEDLALKCPKNLYNGVCTNNQESEQGPKVPPLLMQCRLFYNGCAAKGTLLVNKKLPPNTIQVRDSMVKVQKDPNLPSDPTFNSLEIVSTSHAPKRTYLSKTLIALLSYGGVPNEYFLYILRNALEDSYSAFSNKRAALRVSTDYGNMDNFTLAKMLSSGIPLEEPYLKHRLSILMKEEKKGLITGKIYVPDSYYLTGTADPTGKLESDEVCVVLKNGQVSGKVLVYRNPGLHFGDVHVMKAKYVEELNDVIGNADGGIFFSCKGPRSVADEIAGGDFDGDIYWVSRNPQLLEDFKPSEPWTPNSELHKLEGSSEKPSDLSSPEEFENKLIELLFKKPSYTVGEAADSWMSWMDQFLTTGSDNNDHEYKEKINKLIDIYYDALDAPKQGAKIEIPGKLKAENYPHYMEKKPPFASFASESILGIIYDTVKAYQAEDQSNIEIKKLPYFEVEVSEDCLKKWTVNYKQYRSGMSIALSIDDRKAKNEAAEEVIKYYKKLLYEAEEIDDSRRKREDIYKEALAIYHVTYNYAKTEANVRKCGFAWKVAGSALVEYFLMKQPEKPFMCVPSVLREVL